MLYVVINFLQDKVEVKFTETMPARVIKKAYIEKTLDDSYLHKVQGLLEDLRKTYTGQEISVSVNLPAMVEDLVEVSTVTKEEIVQVLKARCYQTSNKILINGKAVQTKKGTYVVPVALVDMSYMSVFRILQDIKQYTTNIIRLADVADRDNVLGHSTVVYNSEVENPEVLFFDNDNIPVAYTRTLLEHGIVGLTSADDINSQPLDRRKVKSLSHSMDKVFNVDFLPAEQPTEQPVDMDMPVMPSPQDEEVLIDTTQAQEEPKKEKQAKAKKQKEPKPKKEKQPKPKKEKKQKEKKRKEEDDDNVDIMEKVEGKKVSTKIVAGTLTVVIALVIIIFISSKIIADYGYTKITGGNEITFIQEDNIDLTTFVNNSLTALGLRANGVEYTQEDETGTEVISVTFNNIDDQNLIAIQQRLESRCDISVVTNEPTEFTEQGNSNVTITVKYRPLNPQAPAEQQPTDQAPTEEQAPTAEPPVATEEGVAQEQQAPTDEEYVLLDETEIPEDAIVITPEELQANETTQPAE